MAGTTCTPVAGKEAVGFFAGAHQAINFIPSATNPHAGNLADLAFKIGAHDPSVLSQSASMTQKSAPKVAASKGFDGQAMAHNA